MYGKMEKNGIKREREIDRYKRYMELIESEGEKEREETHKKENG